LPTVTFIEPDGTKRTVSADMGESLMEAARKHGVEGIDAECGGAGICATCKVIIAEPWQETVGVPSADELEMLEFAGLTAPGSRLSCQIEVTSRLEGLVANIHQA